MAVMPGSLLGGLERTLMSVIQQQLSVNLAFFKKAIFLTILVALGLALGAASVKAHAADSGVSDGQKRGRSTGLPVPRFVSLKARAVNLRVGPGRKYAISWLYKKRGLPVEVIQEFDQWRRIRDSEGSTGWVLHSLLSSKRTAIVAPWDRANSSDTNEDALLLDAKNDASDEAATVARLQAGLLVNVEECGQGWCEVEVQNTKAWLKQESLWGVYPNEPLDG